MKKILVATDGSAHARKALEFACDIASKYDAVIYLIHVVSFGPLASLASWSYGGAAVETWKDLMKKAGEEIVRQAEKEAKGKGAKTIQIFLAEGDPADEILRFAKKNNVDMIILGRRGAGSVETLLLGSVSHKVSNLADCICVTVK